MKSSAAVQRPNPVTDILIDKDFSHRGKIFFSHEGHEGTRRKRMIPMGNTLTKRGTMTDLVLKAFAGGPGGQFSRKEPPWLEV